MSSINIDEIMKTNPTWKLLSRDKLNKTLKKQGIIFCKADIDRYFESSELLQVFKKPPTSKHDSFRINAEPDSYQIDVVLMAQWPKAKNDNIDRFLLLVDILSRRAFVELLPSNQMVDVIKAYEVFLKRVPRRPAMLSGDDFFSQKTFVDMNAARHIRVITCVAKNVHAQHKGNRLGIIDRCVRTIKVLLQKKMVDSNDSKWTAYLSDIVDLYNTTVHSSLDGKSPIEAYDDIDFLSDMYVRNLEHNIRVREVVNKGFESGMSVRILNDKLMFQKEGESYSRDVYTIVESFGNSFKLMTTEGHMLDRAYMARDLLAVKADRVTNRIDDFTATRELQVHYVAKKITGKRVGCSIDYEKAVSFADGALNASGSTYDIAKDVKNRTDRRAAPSKDIDVRRPLLPEPWDWIPEMIEPGNFVVLLSTNLSEDHSESMLNVPDVSDPTKRVLIMQVDEFDEKEYRIDGHFVCNREKVLDTISFDIVKSNVSVYLPSDRNILAIYDDDTLELSKENIEEIKAYMSM